MQEHMAWESCHQSKQISHLFTQSSIVLCSLQFPQQKMDTTQHCLGCVSHFSAVTL